MKQSVTGWFKLLSQEEGEFYAVPVFSEDGSVRVKTPMEVSVQASSLGTRIERIALFQQNHLPVMGTLSLNSRPLVSTDSMARSISETQALRESDFHFIKVLGKGSFGKVSIQQESSFANTPVTLRP